MGNDIKILKPIKELNNERRLNLKLTKIENKIYNNNSINNIDNSVHNVNNNNGLFSLISYIFRIPIVIMKFIFIDILKINLLLKFAKKSQIKFKKLRRKQKTLKSLNSLYKLEDDIF